MLKFNSNFFYHQVFTIHIWMIIFLITLTSSILLSSTENVLKKFVFHRSMIMKNFIRIWGIFCQQALSGIEVFILKLIKFD